MLIFAYLFSYFWPSRARNRFSRVSPKVGHIMKNETQSLLKLTYTSLQTKNEGRLNFDRGQTRFDISVPSLLNARYCLA